MSFGSILLKMDTAIVYGLVGVATFLMFYYRRKDNSIDLNKTTTIRPVIKFRMYQIKKVVDKETQTDSRSSTPMSIPSVPSLDFPFEFDEDYLNGRNLLNNKTECEPSPTNGLTES